ncbi:MAG: SMC family ATPase [Planctomycetota bacterium]|nr:MAG: SMC family ATPase [Planctomycetota bacterium]
MIVRRLLAEGFMRFERIELGPLPPRGRFAITGPNESGKSTIGEAICFALFGRSVKSDLTDLSQVVGWEAERARVVLELASAGASVRIERVVSREGAHEARAWAGGPEPVAEGPEAVARFVRERLGLDFEAFRASVYLAQDDLRALREEILEPLGTRSETARAVEEIVGIGPLQRAAQTLARRLPALHRRRERLTAQRTVARTLMETHALPAGERERVRTEHTELTAELAAVRAALPTVRERLDALESAIRARGAVGEAFSCFERALLARQTERTAGALEREIVAAAAALERERERVRREIDALRAESGEAREQIDRLIAFGGRLAELQARLELYRAEVRRRLSAPEVDEQDLQVLESVAMPATPAAALRLAETRAARLRRARNRSFTRAGIFAALALVSFTAGLPALVHVLPSKEPRALTGLEQWIAQIVQAIADTGFSEPGRIWVAFAVGGCVGGVLFAVLAALGLRQGRARNEALALAEESRKRLADEVAALEQEQRALAALDMRRLPELLERVRALRNEELAEAFEALASDFGDLVAVGAGAAQQLEEQRARQLERERTLQVLGERRVRIERLLAALPPELRERAATQREAAAPADATDALDLEVLERTLPDRIATWARVRSRLQELERLDEPGSPEACLERLAAQLEAVSLGRVEGESAREPFDVAALAQLCERAQAFDYDALERELERHAETLERWLPRLETLLAERERLERQLAELQGRHDALARSEAQLAAQLETLERQHERYEEARAQLASISAELEPLGREIAVHELAGRLLEETAADLRARLGPTLRRFLAVVLPRITGGRYRRVRVLPNLDLRVYSPEKNDYVPIVDLSAGTAEQLLLVLRLGVGAALGRTRRVDDPEQFLYLDEPLAAFDEGRAVAFLQLLEELEPLFPQVFLVLHGPLVRQPDRFALVIRTELDGRVLVGPGRSEGEAERASQRSPAAAESDGEGGR